MKDAAGGPKPITNQSPNKGLRRSLWFWFLAGFVVVFVGMSLTITVYSFIPSGRGVFSCPLWQYYVVEMRRAISSSGAMGPASGSGAAAVKTLFQHILCSSLGGAIMAGFGWTLRRFNDRKRHA